MKIKILWVDDEIDLLKSHLLFLESKGYILKTANNGLDALELIENDNSTFSVVFLDESMPGLDGLATLQKIKQINPSLPIIMITKNEEEQIMEDAIGQYISDYLIKPVNPNQILLSLKKILEGKKFISKTMGSLYQREFREISIELTYADDFKDWENVYKKLVYWELELEKAQDIELIEILENQKKEANSLFFKFIKENYINFLHPSSKEPILSHKAFKNYVKPHLDKDSKCLLLLIDNLRYDQWKALQPLFSGYYNVQEEFIYCSILPSATQYARNAFFAGMMPLDIEKKYPNQWFNDTDEGKKNDHEDFFLEEQLKRLGFSQLKTSYHKLITTDDEKRLLQNFHQISNNNLIAVVCNIVDIISHAKTNNAMISQLVRGNETYRAITKNWFEYSYLFKLIKKAAEAKMKLLVTTDHGTILVREPSKVIGDKETSTNLRYKLGRNLSYNEKEVLLVEKPESYLLPKVNISSKYIFAKEDLFFAYPNNYHHYANYYKNTYQHGGISLEELLIPFVSLDPK